jgi:hypothetical protein
MAAVIHHTSELPSSPGGWSVVWYDPEADVTYQFSALACLYDECVGRNLAGEFGPNTFSPDNWTAAIAVAQYVSSFEAVRLRYRSARRSFGGLVVREIREHEPDKSIGRHGSCLDDLG